MFVYPLAKTISHSFSDEECFPHRHGGLRASKMPSSSPHLHGGCFGFAGHLGGEGLCGLFAGQVGDRDLLFLYFLLDFFFEFDSVDF